MEALAISSQPKDVHLHRWRAARPEMALLEAFLFRSDKLRMVGPLQSTCGHDAARRVAEAAGLAFGGEVLCQVIRCRFATSPRTNEQSYHGVGLGVLRKRANWRKPPIEFDQSPS